MHPMTHATRSHRYYSPIQVNQTQNQTSYPITIESQQQGFCVAQPIFPIPPNPILPTEIPSPHLMINLQYCLPKYAPKLWSQLNQTPNTKLMQLAGHLNQNQGQLLIVNDASLNTQHHSVFSWTIATQGTELWNRASTSPSMQCHAHSGCSEGYRLLAAFMFIKKYIQASNIHVPLKPKGIHGYCNNSGLIQQVTAFQLNKIPNPSQTISNDYNLSNEIYQTILRIPFPVQLHHVKGHQDETTNIDDLPYEAKLNIVCDECA